MTDQNFYALVGTAVALIALSGSAGAIMRMFKREVFTIAWTSLMVIYFVFGLIIPRILEGPDSLASDVVFFAAVVLGGFFAYLVGASAAGGLPSK